MRHLIVSFIATTTLILFLASCGEEKRPLTYVSLGDSLAVGVGSSDPPERGFAPLYEQALSRKTDREVRLIQLGVSGETSESFIGSYPDPDSSQLARAASALDRHPGATVTISLGGNDLMRAADGTDAERAAAIEEYGRNLDEILTTLENASDPAPRISILALYNPKPGSFTDKWTGRLNKEIRTVAKQHGAAVADGYRAFRGHEEEYSHQPHDIHPTDAGYKALARAFERAEKPG